SAIPSLFNVNSTTNTSTISLHDALPIFGHCGNSASGPSGNAAAVSKLSFLCNRGQFSCLNNHYSHLLAVNQVIRPKGVSIITTEDRKSTRLNSSHVKISYAVFRLKKEIH